MLALGQPRFGAAHVHDDVRTFDALHDAIDQLADARVELVVDCVALGFAHFLQNHLLGGLRCDAAQHVGRLGLGNFAADFHVRLTLARVVQRNFAYRVGHFLHHHVH